MNIINIAAYRFVALDDLLNLRENLKDKCLELELKGTILLAPEGINLFLAGTPENIQTFIQHLTSDERFSGMEFKESPSSDKPFNRLLVKLKKEIIPMGLPEISPITNPAPGLSAETLKSWLDEGREVVLLDTRNDYEVSLGTFKNAVHLDIEIFREFPEKIKELLPELQDKVIVSFCTGGIRCEKAAPAMLNVGFKNVYQLNGGILKYFEEVGGDHYEGDCFVFDKRVALTPALEQSDIAQCFNCLSTVNAEEQKSAAYVPGVSCPKCINGKPIKKSGINLSQRRS